VEVRTLEDFVEDMYSDGKNLKQILAVAASTRWKNFGVQIKEAYDRIANKRK